MVLYRFDNTSSKNLIEFFNFVFNCRFYFVFLVVFNFLYNEPVWLAFPWRADEPMYWFWKIDNGFHDFENNCFLKWKKNIAISQFFSFYCLFVTWSRLLRFKDDIIFFRGRCQKGLVSQNLMFLKNSLWIYCLRPGFFTKKVNLFLIFVLIDVLFVDVRHILHKYRSWGLLLEE